MSQRSLSLFGRPALALLAGFLVLAACTPAEAQLTVESLIGEAVSTSSQKYPDVENAIKRFTNQDFEAAREYLDRAKKKHPELPPTSVTLAKMFMLARDAQRSRLFLEKAVADNPDDPEAYLILADQAFAGNRWTESEALFEKGDTLTQQFNSNAQRKRNFEIRVLAGKAAVAQRRGHWEEAQKYLEQWIELDPDNALAHQRLGGTLFQLDEAAKAYDEFARARELRSDLSHPYVALAQHYAAKGETEKARENFQKAYEQESDNDATAQAYATWLLQQREFDEAQQIATKLREKNPESEAALLMAGVVAQLKGEREQAEEALAKLLTVNPSDAKATNLLALLLVESPKVSDQEKALRYAQVNAERFPQNPQTQVTLAWVQHKLGRRREADQALQRGIQAGNLNADSRYLISKILADRDEKDRATQILADLLKRSEATFLYRREAEELYQQLGGNLDDLTSETTP